MTDAIHVPPFTIVIDNREKAPFRFAGMRQRESKGGRVIIPRIESRALPTGDYSIDGFEQRIAVERKSKSDLYASISGERGRFEREFERLSEFDFAACVIECDWANLRIEPVRTQVPFASVEGTIIAWAVRWPAINWMLCEDRRHAEWVTFRMLETSWKIHGRTPARDSVTA